MNRTDPNQPVNLLLCERRCSDAFRSIASENGWALLEGAGSIQAARACVAMSPDRVCVELIRSARIAPDLIRRLGAMDSVGHIACYTPNASAALEQDLRRLGASLLTTIREAECWLLGSRDGSRVDRAGGVTIRGVTRRARGLAPMRDVFG
jgi:hypothetical protein